ncbi:hypothetical protein VP03_30950 [Sinorhizobium meliloti]|nr:hypothetical protein VP03_30950 [Sinorhizobium meliloti]
MLLDGVSLSLTQMGPPCRLQYSRRLLMSFRSGFDLSEQSCRSSPVTEPIDYMLKRWGSFTSFLGDGRICLAISAGGPRRVDQHLYSFAHPQRA